MRCVCAGTAIYSRWWWWCAMWTDHSHDAVFLGSARVSRGGRRCSPLPCPDVACAHGGRAGALTPKWAAARPTGGNAHPVRGCRRRGRAAVRDSRARARHGPVHAHRARAVPEGVCVCVCARACVCLGEGGGRAHCERLRGLCPFSLAYAHVCMCAATAAGLHAWTTVRRSPVQQLVVGGLERVFEMGKVFRNEGARCSCVCVSNVLVRLRVFVCVFVCVCVCLCV